MGTDEANLKDDMAKLRADVARLTEDLKSMASRQGNAAYERARDAANAATAQVRDQVHAAGERVSATVQDRPITSVVVAFLAGCLISKLFSR